MNDRFKFRAWANGQWHVFEMGAEWSVPKSILYESLTATESKFYPCTGMADKNGTLIYDGAPVECVWNYRDNGPMVKTGKVIWRGDSYHIHVDAGLIRLDDQDRSTIEVIENPEFTEH